MRKNQQTIQTRRKQILTALVLTMLLGFLMSQSVQAEPVSGLGTLYVCGTKIMYASELYETVVTDGNGGTAVYDYDNNTLTLTNFHKDAGEKLGIQASYMGDDFAIILKGNNSFETTYHATMDIYKGNLCITGGGVSA